MGGLRKKMPWTFWTFLIGDAGHRRHPALAGFFTKDEILGQRARPTAPHRALRPSGLVTAG